VRLFYLALSYVLAPFVVLIIVWKGLRNRAYWERVEERFGFGRSRTDRRAIWIHAVSVGEVTAASSMVRELLNRYPHLPVVMTTVTPTGARRVQDLFGDQVIHSYIPYDMPGAVVRFFDRFNPRLAVIMETELWPNLYNECGRRRVPLVLANARVSPRSVYKYRRFVSLFSETLSHGIVIAAQSRRDADRFRWIGAPPERTHVVGNIKFDLELPVDQVDRGRQFREEQLAGRPVWIAASTHEGEEEQVLEAHRLVRESLPEALLILVPRHPERFQAVAGLLGRRRLSFVRRGSGEAATPETEVFLGDTLGELTLFYAAADAAFVGGSLVPIGGHNALEPAALGLPIMTGPYTFNAEDIAEMLQDAGAAVQVEDTPSLAEAATRLLSDPALRKERGDAGRRIVAENRGALERLMGLLEPLLAEFPDR
jgi:3-deoxy-D-manno-octulosonic-acid transferase